MASARHIRKPPSSPNHDNHIFLKHRALKHFPHSHHSWNVPNRSNSCSISILIENINASFPLCHRIFFQPFPIFSSNVHITTAENGTIIITFSMHSVVSFCSPFTVSQIPQPPMTLDNLTGFPPVGLHALRWTHCLARNAVNTRSCQSKELLPQVYIFLIRNRFYYPISAIF